VTAGASYENADIRVPMSVLMVIEELKELPAPEYDLCASHLTIVSETQTDELHTDEPICAVTDMSLTPKLTPYIVTEVACELGMFGAKAALTVGESYENVSSSVPTYVPIVSARRPVKAVPSPLALSPAAGPISEMHVTVVPDIHALVPQPVEPIRSEAETSVEAKLRPLTVTDEEPVVGEFGLETAVNTGLSNENVWKLVPVTDEIVSIRSSAGSLPAPFAQVRCVSLIHIEVEHIVVPIRMVGVLRVSAKFIP
jgi:hypothetical protein